MKKVLIALSLLLVSSFSAKAEEIFVNNNDVYNPTLPNIVNTWMKYSDEFILTDRELLNNYLALNDCEKYKSLKNEIELEEARNEVKKFLLDNREKQPHIYRFVKPMVIENYDFDNEKIILENESKLKEVAFVNIPLKSISFRCGNNTLGKLNKGYVIDLKGEINIDEISLDLETAKQFIPKMRKIRDKMVFFLILEVDLAEITVNTRSQLIFSGDVIDIGYYTDPGDENRFGEYKFKKEEKIDYLKDLQFVPTEKSTY